MGKIKIFGEEIIDVNAINQLENCLGPDDIGVLTADAHYGYNHPIGGAIAYKNKISLSGVGFDIGCGNKAVKTDILAKDISMEWLMSKIVHKIGFGVGRPNPVPIENEIFDKIDKLNLKIGKSEKTSLLTKSINQLGTIGSGNHFVDIFEDMEDGHLWIGVHFGSRGFGHTLTKGFIALSQNKGFSDKVSEGGMDGKPILFDVNSEIGMDYIESMNLAGEYAYAGRDYVCDTICGWLGAIPIMEVHNHHNFAWKENHFGEDYWVVRKGCTPAFPGQKGFIGANMFDTSVIVEGVETENSADSLFSTVHGAGRVLSRTQARGKVKYLRGDDGKKRPTLVAKGLVDYKDTKQKAKDLGITLKGGGADESPECYKKLDEVLGHMGDTIKVLHRLKPIGVAMADEKIVDPYKD